MNIKIIVCLCLFGCCLLPLGSTTLQEMYDQAEPGAGYDRLVILESGEEYAGGLRLIDGIFYEGFESATFPPEGWNVYNLDGSTSWCPDDQNAYTGNQCAAHPNNSSASESWLVMPQMSLTEPCSLLFHRYNTDITWYPSFGVWISTGSGDPADGEFVLLESFSTVTNWSFSVADLSNYQGNDVYIAFHYMAANHPAWYIDDVYIGTMPTNEKVKILGNGAIVNLLERRFIEIEYQNILDIDGLVVVKGHDYAVNYRSFSSGYISNSTFYDNRIGVLQQSAGDAAITLKNVIMANNLSFGFQQNMDNTAYFSHMCAFDNRRGNYVSKHGP